MASSPVNEYQRLTNDIVTLAQRDLEAFWKRLNKTDIEIAREALTEFTTALVETYGRPASLVAAQFYDDMRTASPNAPGRFRATLADPPKARQVAGTVRWAVAPLTGPEPDDLAALGRMSGATQRYVNQAGRDTIVNSARMDPGRPSYARVPKGTHPCDFCLMLASRGAVYGSAETAGAGTHYHDHCHCVPTPMWDGDPNPTGYDPDKLYDEYQERLAVTST